MLFTRPIRRTAAVLAGAAALALAAGCGSDDGGGDDEAEIAAVITKSFTSTDVEEQCVETVTTGYVRTVFGDLATCRAAEGEDDDPPPTGATASDIEVDGDTATARVTTVGGTADGATGTLTLAKEGGAWKVDELGVDLLRSQFAKAFENDTFDADDGPLEDVGVRTCVKDGLEALDDDEFRSTAYALIAEKGPPESFTRIFAGCVSEAGDDSASDESGSTDDADGAPAQDDEELSLLRRQFEQGIRESAQRDGATKAQIDCVLRETRRSISEDEIVEQVGRGADDVAPELAQKAAAAIQKCG